MMLKRLRHGLEPRIVVRFFEWWIAELQGVFQPLLRRVSPPRQRVVLTLLPERTQVGIVSRDGSAAEVVSIPSGFDRLDEAPRYQLHRMTANADLDIQLDTRDVWGVRLKPLGRSRPTTESIRYRLVNDSPVDVTLIHFAWRLGRPATAASGDALIEVAICRKSKIQEVLASAEALGLRVSRIMGLPNGFESSSCFEFEVEPRLAEWKPLRAYRTAILVGSAVLIPLLALGAVGAYASFDAARKGEEVTDVREQLRAYEGLAQRRTELVATATELRKWTESGSVASVMNDLARLLPDNTWAMELIVDAGTIRLIGLSSDPPAAAKALASSKLLANIRLSSVGSPMPDRGVSQFEVTAELVKTHE